MTTTRTNLNTVLWLCEPCCNLHVQISWKIVNFGIDHNIAHLRQIRNITDNVYCPIRNDLPVCTTETNVQGLLDVQSKHMALLPSMGLNGTQWDSMGLEMQSVRQEASILYTFSLDSSSNFQSKKPSQ